MSYRPSQAIVIGGVRVPPNDPAIAAFGDACARCHVTPQDFSLLLHKMARPFEAMMRRGPVDYAALNDLHLLFQAEATALGINASAAASIGDAVGMSIIASADIALPEGLPVPAATVERIAALKAEFQQAAAPHPDSGKARSMTEDQAHAARIARMKTYVDENGNVDWEAANRDPLLTDGPASQWQNAVQERTARGDFGEPQTAAPESPSRRADLQQRVAALRERVVVGDPTVQAEYEAIMQEYETTHGTEPAASSSSEDA